MRRALTWSSTFVRDVKHLKKQNPLLSRHIDRVLELLAEDAFHPRLHTHKLKGSLSAYWACSAGYDLRLVFELVNVAGLSAILLLSIGSHDDVY